MPFLGKCLEHLRGDAGVAAHADADHGDLGHVGGAVHLEVADILLGRLQHLERALQVGLLHGERHVGVFAVGGRFCTIMSTLMLASARGPKMRAATPGLSSTLMRVTLASSLA